MTGKITNHKSRIANIIDSMAIIGVIALAAVRLLVTFRSVWTWETGSDVPVTDVGPVGTAVSDALCVVTLMVAMVGAWIGQRRLHGVMVGLWLCGAAGAMGHAWWGSGDLFSAGSWIGATALGLAAMVVGHASVSHRRLILAGVMAMGAAIGMDAIWQVTIQHEWTVRNYRENKQQVLEQHQWAEGSVEQQKFEVRLMQKEATGAIGLSNVFGTAAGAVTLLGAGWMIAAWKCKEDEEEGVGASARKVRGRIRWAVGACALLGGVALVCSFSKGAISACALVGGVFAMTAWVTSAKPQAAKNVWRNVAFIVVMLGIAAVVGRWWVLGIQTTPGGERSLLFRGFYWEAAAKMVREEPIAGIGPGRFQDMYMVMKNPLSPEDVADPHNVVVAWVSQLGLAGWAWVVMVGAMLWKAAPGSEDGRCASPAKPPEAERARWEIGIIAAGLAFGTQYVVQFAEMLPETAVMWVIGATLFAVMVGYAPAMKLNERWLSIGALASATVALLHSQIDMGLTNVGTAPLLMAVIGAAAAPAPGSMKTAGVEASASGRRGRWCGGGVLVLMVLLLVGWAVQINDAAASRAKEMARLKAYMSGDFESAAKVERSPVSVEPRVVNVLANAAMVMAQRQPTHRDAWLDRGLLHYQLTQHRSNKRAALMRGEAQYALEAWRMTQDRKWADLAGKAAETALLLDPYGTRMHVEMAELLEKLEQRQAAGELYQRAISLDAMKYLDGDSQMSDSQRAQIKQRLDRLR